MMSGVAGRILRTMQSAACASNSARPWSRELCRAGIRGAPEQRRFAVDARGNGRQSGAAQLLPDSSASASLLSSIRTRNGFVIGGIHF